MEKIMIEPKDVDDFITGIRGFVDANNKLVLSWSYPENSQFNICVIYEVKDEDEPLSNLILKPHAGIYDLDFASKHMAAISDSVVRYKLFPAFKRENRLYIVNQKGGNVSGRFLKRVKLYYQVTQKRKKLLEKYKTVTISITGSSETDVTELYYRISGSPYDMSYGIDLTQFPEGEGCSILLKPEENISFYLSEEQKSYIDLIRKNG